MSAVYKFLPWVRQGAATAVRAPDTLGAGVAGRPSLPAGVRVNGRQDVSVSLRLHGPGDVAGFDTRVILRTDPPNYAGNFEPNYFPAIEFAVPSLPWLLTPATGDPQGRLRPWMVLVVVRKQPGVTLSVSRDRPLPVLRIEPPARPVEELPDLADSWAWAHTQVLGSDDTAVRELLQEGNGVLARLVSPRRLRPRESYLACLVPAFAAGRRAGLGEMPDPADAELQPAWSSADPVDTLELPVYFRWEFSTGVGGDFETLARRLRGQPLPEGVGVRTLRVGDAGFGLPDGGALALQGALCPPDAPAGPGAPQPFRDALLDLLNTPERLREQGGDGDPLVAPPVYGSWQAAQRRLDPSSPLWLREVNADPRLRAAAGLGTMVVQDQQEQLMASAWEQLGEAAHAQERTNRRELGRTVLGRVHQALTQLPPEAFLRVTAPMHTRVQLQIALQPAEGGPVGGVPITVFQQIRTSSLPVSVVSSPFRRVTRPLGPLVRSFSLGAEASGGTGSGGGAGAAGATGTAAAAAGAVASAGVVGSAAVAGEGDAGGVAGAGTTVGVGPIRTAPLSVAFTGIRRGVEADAPAARSARPLSFAGRFDPGRVGAAATARALPAGGTVTAAAIDTRVQGLTVLSTMLAESQRFREAAAEMTSYLARLVGGGQPQPKPGLQLTAVKAAMLTRLEPAVTLPPPAGPAQPTSPEGTAGGGTGTATAPPVRSLPGPAFPQPMYEFLRDLAPDLLLPGLDRIPPDSATLLETNPPFIEAYMLGLNHEMSRELLWREYPSDLRGTPFRRFWGGGSMMPEIHEWTGDSELGSHLEAGDGDQQLVLLVRGELLQRYPATVIYASPALDAVTPAPEKHYPTFRAALGPDMTCVGFGLTPDQVRGDGVAPGWFFILEQPPGQPRFGLDESDETGRDPTTLTSWNQLAWGDTADDPQALESLNYLRVGGRLLGHRIGGLEWGRNAGHMAAITLQRPVRVLLPAVQLLPPEEGGPDV